MIAQTAFRLLAPAGRRARLSVFIFHRVHRRRDPLFPHEADAVSFEQRMEWIARWFNVLPVPDAVRRLRAGTLPARALCLTFDDGYADNASVALPILRRLRLPATFFIATRFLDGGRMWNDSIIEAIRRTSADPLDLSSLGFGIHPLDTSEARRRAIDALLPQLKYLAIDERQAKVDAIVARTGAKMPDDLMMTSEDVRRLHEAGMTIGGHTHSHPILTRLGPAEAEREIRIGAERLGAIIGERVSLFAYPNGRPGADYHRTHVDLVKSLGFEAAFSTEWGVATSRSDRYQLPRFTPWSRSKWKFGAQLAENLLRGEPAASRETEHEATAGIAHSG